MTTPDTEQTTESPVAEDLAKEIEKGIEAVIPDTKSDDDDKPAPEKEEDPKEETSNESDNKLEEQEEDAPADEDEDAEPKEDEEEDPSEGDEGATDEQLTRAVKAGMSLADAKAFADTDALDRMSGMLEQSAKQDEGGDKSEEGKSRDDGTDPLDAIPDLDPEEYDEALVTGFKAMKDIIALQRKEIGELRDGTQSNSRAVWVDRKVDNLPIDEYTAAQRVEINSAIDVLEAGYKATGQEVDLDTIFEQASKTVFGDEIRKAEQKVKTNNAKKRASAQTVRPGGTNAKAKGDPLEEIAKEIDKRYTNEE